MKKAVGCMGTIILCILLFVVGIGLVMGTITLLSHNLLEDDPHRGTEYANKKE